MRQPDGMPSELWTAVQEAAIGTRETMLENWQLIGADGRNKLTQYVTRGWTRRSRRQRGQLAAEQLLDPATGTPMGTPPSLW